MLKLRWLVVMALVFGCVGYFSTASAEDKKPKKSPEEVFKAMDANKDGVLTEEDFLARAKTDEAKEKAKKIFASQLKLKDKNNDGKLSMEEYTAKVERAPREKKDKK